MDPPGLDQTFDAGLSMPSALQEVVVPVPRLEWNFSPCYQCRTRVLETLGAKVAGAKGFPRQQVFCSQHSPVYIHS